MSAKIPTRNIYYLLAYAWEFIGRGEEDFLSDDSFQNSTELLARIFNVGFSVLLRRGLAKDYCSHEEVLAGVRGKLLFSQTVSSGALRSGRTICATDEHTTDHGLNQLLRATLELLLASNELTVDTQRALRSHLFHLKDVNSVPLTNSTFKSVRLHSHTKHYEFLIHLSRLVLECMSVSDSAPGSRIQSFLERESRMHDVFETFVRRFYERHLTSEYRVSRERYLWKVETTDSLFLERVPGLNTDITVTSPQDVLIIETKYYSEALVERHGRFKFRRDHLSQLMDYLRTAQKLHQLPVRGLLLYPAVNEQIHNRGMIEGFDITVATVDLSEPWQEIERSLLFLAEPAKSAA